MTQPQKYSFVRNLFLWRPLSFSKRSVVPNPEEALVRDHLLTSGRTTVHAVPITLLFVDVDGVLNIGISDPGSSPLSCNEENISRAQTHTMPSSLTQRILSVSSRQVANENTTYGMLCKGSDHLSDVYVGRLALLVAAAKTRGRVICVLSSSWRNYFTRGVRALEEALSKHLRAPFTFDAETDAQELKNPSGRACNIGGFLKKWSASCPDISGTVRVLVIEDFGISPLNGWQCGGKPIKCTDDVEAYWRECLPSNIDARVCLIHTFDEWTSGTGMSLKIGSGLTLDHFQKAIKFLNEGTEDTDVHAIPFERAVSEPGDESFLNEDTLFERGVSW